MRKIVVMMCVMLLYLAGAAYADIQEFRYFSLDVPEGWSVKEDGAVVTVTEDVDGGSLKIPADDPKGKTRGDLAVKYSQDLQGSEPEQDEDGSYLFEFDDGESQAVIDGTDDLYLLIIGTGLEQSGEVMAEILASLEMK